MFCRPFLRPTPANSAIELINFSKSANKFSKKIKKQTANQSLSETTVGDNSLLFFALAKVILVL
jgi:hypothetical protein